MQNNERQRNVFTRKTKNSNKTKATPPPPKKKLARTMQSAKKQIIVFRMLFLRNVSYRKTQNNKAKH